MTVAAEVEVEILRLHFAEHLPVGTIARQLAVHDDVVRRVVGLTSPLRKLPPPGPRLCAPFADFIADTLARYPTLRATRIYDMVKERGYAGSVRTLREHVAVHRPAPRAEAFLRVESLVGEQAQVDWAHVGNLPVEGGQRALWAFVLVLSWSRAMWAELVFDLTAHSLCRSLVRAAEAFGGCPRQWGADNHLRPDPGPRAASEGFCFHMDPIRVGVELQRFGCGSRDRLGGTALWPAWMEARPCPVGLRRW